MSDPAAVPPPGEEAAPDSSTQGVDEAVHSDGNAVEHHEQSSVGPGAGENEVVKVRSPVQREGDEVTSHPTLRNDEQADRT
jgi:hypothetical protein